MRYRMSSFYLIILSATDNNSSTTRNRELVLLYVAAMSANVIQINDLERCPQCMGAKQYRYVGGMIKNCTECKATGFVLKNQEKSDEKEISQKSGQESTLEKSKIKRRKKG